MAAKASLLDQYNFRRAAQRIRLPKFLREASGLAMLGESQVVLHHDNSALVWILDVQTSQLSSTPLQNQALRGDFEGIAQVAGNLFMSTSHADILEFAPPYTSPPTQHSTQFKSLCNFEGLAALANPDQGVTLLLPCKYPKFVEAGLPAAQDHLLYLFRHPLRDGATKLPTLAIDTTQVLQTYGMKRLRPSAIAVVNDRLLILAGKERVLLETTLEGELIAWRRLRWPRHRQAEGLTLSMDGTLIVADEGRWLGGTVTSYRRR